MESRTVLITGANSGIGKETAREIARQRAHVIMACRSQERGESARKEIIESTGNEQVDLMIVDLASLDSIRHFAAEVASRYGHLDVLVNNGGVFCMKRQTTADGFERTFGTNHLGWFLLTSLLTPLLMKGSQPRIVNLGSDAHRYARLDLDDLMFDRRRYSGFKAYSQSRLATVFYTQELAKRLASTGITVNCAHPGHVATNIWSFGDDAGPVSRLVARIQTNMAISPKEGAQCSIRLATAPELAGVTGRYFTPDGEKKPARKCQDTKTQERLWEIGANLVGLTEP